MCNVKVMIFFCTFLIKDRGENVYFPLKQMGNTGKQKCYISALVFIGKSIYISRDFLLHFLKRNILNFFSTENIG